MIFLLLVYLLKIWLHFVKCVLPGIILGEDYWQIRWPFPGVQGWEVCGLKMLEKCSPKSIAFSLSEEANDLFGPVIGGDCCFILSKLLVVFQSD